MLKKLFDLNQVAKNLNPDSIYMYRDGKVFSYSRYGGIAYIENMYLDIFERGKLYKIDGKEIYDILKNKSTPKQCSFNIVEETGDIEIYPTIFEATKAISVIIKCISERDSLYKEYNRIVEYISQYETINDNFTDITSSFNKFIEDKGIRLDIGEEHKITLVKNFMVSYSKTDKIFMNVTHPIITDNGVTYIVTIKQTKSKMDVFIKVLCVKM